MQTGTRMKLLHWAGVKWLMFRMFPLPNFYKHSEIRGWLLPCPEDGPLRITAPKSVSLHGDHGQDSFVGVPADGSELWTNHTGVRGPGRRSTATQCQWTESRRLRVPPCSEMSPGLGQLPGETYWGTAPVSRFSGWWTVELESCCCCLLPARKKDKWQSQAVGKAILRHGRWRLHLNQ